MMGDNFFDLAIKYGFSLVVALFVASKAISAMFRAKPEIAAANHEAAQINARTDTIEMLLQRVGRLEEEFEEERSKRVEAEDLVDKLTRRVASLEHQIRQLGHEPRP
jgi:phage shock protein A